MFITISLFHKIHQGISKIILNVAEKNEAAKSIAKLLSKGQTIMKESHSTYNKIYEFKYQFDGEMRNMVMTSVSGHLLQYVFPVKFKKWAAVDPIVLFESPLEKICPENSLNIKKSLEELINKCNVLVIWTDCDREGENIGMEIVDVCLAVNPDVIVKRARFSEITIKSVTKAINNLVDMNLLVSEAVNVRQEFDLRSGAAFTRLQTLSLQHHFPSLSTQVISYGSCQFPTMGFVVDRFKEIENFVIEPFWKIVLTHEKQSNLAVFNWDKIKLFDEDLIKLLFEKITNGGSLARVISVETKPKTKLRPVAMNTITLEKLSSTKLKISPQQTMTIAENLYSKGFISYPRTDTNIFSNDIDLKSIVTSQIGDHRWGEFAEKLLSGIINPHNGKKTDQGHPPIYPLKLGNELRDNDAKLFELITRHFLACLSKNAKGNETIMSIDCISKSQEINNWLGPFNSKKYNRVGEGFHINGLVITEKNYLEVYPYENWSDKEVPLYEIGEIFSPCSVVVKQGSTSPPSLLTDSDLLTLMDKHGIGTDATHASHIQKVKTRDYVEDVGDSIKYLVPGNLGMGLIAGYDKIGISLSRPTLRSLFEADLEQICKGTKQPHDVLQFYLNEYKLIYQETTKKLTSFIEGVSKYVNKSNGSDNSSFQLTTVNNKREDDTIITDNIIELTPKKDTKDKKSKRNSMILNAEASKLSSQLNASLKLSENAEINDKKS